ncbi:uncharacterized protein LOC144638446 [Oculina patagonica]
MISRTEASARRLRKSADQLDKVWKDCKIAHLCGTTAGIVGGILTIGGGVATMMSSGFATPLLLLWMGFGAGGAVTNLGTSIVEASINSTEIKKAGKVLKDCKIDVNDCDQLWLDRKEKGRLLYMCFLLVRALEISDPVIKIVQELLLRSVDDVAHLSIGAGSQTEGKLVGGLIIGVSAAFIIWDAKDLRSTMRNLYLAENKGSEVVKRLRQKANELDNIN